MAPRSAWVTAVALPLVFAGSLYVVPGGFGATSLPMAFALTALSSLLVLLISGTGRALHTGVIAACVFGGGSATAMLLWDPPVRTVGRAPRGGVGDRGVPGAAGDDRAVEAAHSAGADRRRAARRHRNPGRHHGRGRQRDRQADHPHRRGPDPTGPARQRVPHRDPGGRRARRGRWQLSGRRRQQRILLAGHGFRRGGGDRAVSAGAQSPRFGAVGDPHRQRARDRDRRPSSRRRSASRTGRFARWSPSSR